MAIYDSTVFMLNGFRYNAEYQQSPGYDQISKEEGFYYYWLRRWPLHGLSFKLYDAVGVPDL